MVQQAVEDDVRFKASNVEFHLEQPSYTIHTLALLKEKHPDYSFVLLMGGDNLASIHKWKNYQQILEDYKIYVYKRPGTEKSNFDTHPSVSIFQAPYIQLSSSYIREEIQNKKM